MIVFGVAVRDGKTDNGYVMFFAATPDGAAADARAYIERRPGARLSGGVFELDVPITDAGALAAWLTEQFGGVERP